jgi:hypothetical protein
MSVEYDANGRPVFLDGELRPIDIFDDRTRKYKDFLIYSEKWGWDGVLPSEEPADPNWDGILDETFGRGSWDDHNKPS